MKAIARMTTIAAAATITLFFGVTASAEENCDLMALNGVGTQLPNGTIVGSEVLTNLATQAQHPVNFTSVPFGALELDPQTGAITLQGSHHFQSAIDSNVGITTFDEIKVLPLGGTDATCTANPCGLIFTLNVETGTGPYNCGRFASGYDTNPEAAIPFTSYVDPFNPDAEGNTVVLNSVGKLCACTGD
jgi:hypothetical protein